MSKKQEPARTIEGRENQLINLAVNCAEEKLKNGTASSQLICLLLGLATTKAKLELEKLKGDVKVSEAKVKQIQNQETSKDLYQQALQAFRSYSGSNYEEDDYADEEY